MRSRKNALAYVLLGIAAANAALAGFFVAQGAAGAAILFAIMTGAVIIFMLTGAASQGVACTDQTPRTDG
ncbi:hypothetical protein L2D01_09885 [Hyphomonadaceae bacterium ML37]|nr:hypothetical protein L2D01_09885 [Hyphomonadaceae bacterium ML37]